MSFPLGNNGGGEERSLIALEGTMCYAVYKYWYLASFQLLSPNPSELAYQDKMLFWILLLEDLAYGRLALVFLTCDAAQ